MVFTLCTCRRPSIICDSRVFVHPSAQGQERRIETKAQEVFVLSRLVRTSLLHGHIFLFFFFFFLQGEDGASSQEEDSCCLNGRCLFCHCLFFVASPERLILLRRRPS